VEGSKVLRRRRSHIFWTIGSQMAVILSALSSGRPLSAGRSLVLISVRRWVDPRFIARLKGLGQLKKSNDLIGNRTRDLLACCKVPEPTTLPRGIHIHTWHQLSPPKQTLLKYKQECINNSLSSGIYNAVYFVGSQPTFRMNMSPSSSGSKNKPSKKPTWKQEASRVTCSSETSFHFQRTKRLYIPGDRTLLSHHSENLKIIGRNSLDATWNLTLKPV
jgi:hypothetical protein